MKMLSSILAYALFCGAVHAQEPNRERPARPERSPSPEIIKKYDQDGDGKLSGSEIAEWRKDMRERRQARSAEILKRFDADGDGVLNDEERKTARETIRKEMLAKYDADGNGELDESERAAMRRGEGFDPLMGLERPQRARPNEPRGERRPRGEGRPQRENRQRPGAKE